MKINTFLVYPPIPTTKFDVCAMYDCDDGDSGRAGWGATKEEATKDLIDNFDAPNETK